MNIFKYVCHQRPDRSFFIRGHQFPLCSRCTGFVAGTISFIIFSFFYPIHYSYNLLLLSVILQLPYIIDGFTQLFGLRESFNMLRFITGFIGAFGLIIMARITALVISQLL